MGKQEAPQLEKIWSLGNSQKLAAYTQMISEHLVVEAAVRAGQKVLDLAAGSGNTTVAAARRRARVTASDVVPGVLDIARKRIEAELLDGVEYHVGNSSPTIDFPDQTFDTVLSSFGAVFFPDHQQVVDELLRVTRPGGTIGLALWSQASMPSDVFNAGQGIKAGATESDRIQPAYLMSNGDYLREKLRGRAASVRLVSGVCESCFEKIDDFLHDHFTCHPPGILRMASYNEEQREVYKRRMTEIAHRYNRATDGTLAIACDYTIVTFVKA